MKKNEKEKWKEEVFDSIKGIKRAQPNAQLFEKIQANVAAPEAKIISLSQKRLAISAAILLLLTNAFVLQRYVQGNNTNAELVESSRVNQQLISNYNIYE